MPKNAGSKRLASCTNPPACVYDVPASVPSPGRTGSPCPSRGPAGTPRWHPCPRPAAPTAPPDSPHHPGTGTPYPRSPPARPPPRPSGRRARRQWGGLPSVPRAAARTGQSESDSRRPASRAAAVRSRSAAGCAAPPPSASRSPDR